MPISEGNRSGQFLESPIEFVPRPRQRATTKPAKLLLFYPGADSHIPVGRSFPRRRKRTPQLFPLRRTPRALRIEQTALRGSRSKSACGPKRTTGQADFLGRSLCTLSSSSRHELGRWQGHLQPPPGGWSFHRTSCPYLDSRSEYILRLL